MTDDMLNDEARVWVIQPDTPVTVETVPNGLVRIRLGVPPDEKYLIVHPEGAVAAGDALFKVGLNGRGILSRLAATEEEQ